MKVRYRLGWREKNGVVGNDGEIIIQKISVK